MNISEQTLKFLQTFAFINEGIFIKAAPDGATQTRIRTKDKDGQAYAEVTVPEVFPKDVCFWELNKFIKSVKSLGGSMADVTFHDTKATIKNKDKVSINIVYTEPSFLIHPQGEFPPMNPDISFTVSENDMKSLLDCSQIHGLDEIRIFSKDGKIILQAIDSKLPSSSTFELEVADGTLQEVYAFKKEWLNIIPGEYRFEIDHEQVDLWCLTHADSKLKYTILLLERD